MNAGMLIPAVLLLLAGPVSVRAEALVDPMRPEHYQAPAPVKKSEEQKIDTTSWSLTAVLSAADRVVAVINGKSLQTGDVLQGYTVMNIESDQALLQNGEKQLVLQRVGTGLKKNIR
jgi:hypothetical protein